MGPAIDPHRLVGHPGDGVAEDLGMKRAQIETQVIERQPGRAQTPAELGGQARFVQRMTLVSRQPFDRRRHPRRQCPALLHRRLRVQHPQGNGWPRERLHALSHRRRHACASWLSWAAHGTGLSGSYCGWRLINIGNAPRRGSALRLQCASGEDAHVVPPQPSGCDGSDSQRQGQRA